MTSWLKQQPLYDFFLGMHRVPRSLLGFGIDITALLHRQTSQQLSCSYTVQAAHKLNLPGVVSEMLGNGKVSS